LGAVPGGALRDAALVAFVARSRLPLTGEYALCVLAAAMRRLVRERAAPDACSRRRHAPTACRWM
jgi:hypothetical protein